MNALVGRLGESVTRPVSECKIGSKTCRGRQGASLLKKAAQRHGERETARRSQVAPVPEPALLGPPKPRRLDDPIAVSIEERRTPARSSPDRWRRAVTLPSGQ
jgi:hypothetical protein